jgi:hypothetical protein
LRRLELQATSEMLEIPQRDGTVACSPVSEYLEAYSNMMDRLGVGEDAPPEHPLIAAARHSSDLDWSKSFFAVEDPDEWVKPIPDLSE